jgi:NAD(P)H dehydrogenase (quinone)
MLSVTVGTSRETYMYDNRSGDIDLMLWPVNFNLAYAGFTVLEHFVAYGVEAGLRYSDPAIVEARLQNIVQDFRAVLRGGASARSVIPFNRKAEGAPTDASSRAPRFIRPSSGGNSVSTWSEAMPR